MSTDASQNDPERRISKRIRHAVDLLVSGDASTQAEAAKQAGLSREHLNRALKEAHIGAFYERKCREKFHQLVPKALKTIERVIDSGNMQAALNGSIHVLNVVGIKPAEGPAAVNISISPGYVIALQGVQERPELTPHQAASQAKHLIDLTPVPGEVWGTPDIVGSEPDASEGDGHE